MQRTINPIGTHILVFLAAAIPPCVGAKSAELWVNLVDGEEVAEERMIEDLATAGVIYAGEMHTIDRHHAMQLGLMRQLHAKGIPLALCMEQLEARRQESVDKFNRREIDFDALATEIDWAKSWKTSRITALSASSRRSTTYRSVQSTRRRK